VTIQFWTDEELDVNVDHNNIDYSSFNSVFVRIQNTQVGTNAKAVVVDLKYLLKPHRITRVEEVWLDFSAKGTDAGSVVVGAGTEVEIERNAIVALKLTVTT